MRKNPDTPAGTVHRLALDSQALRGNLLGDPMQPVEIGASVEAVFEPHDDATPPFTLVQWRRTR